MIIKAYLGWANPETHGGENLRLYSLERQSPRWEPKGGWTIERELIAGMSGEGDRYLVIKLGDRFFPEEFTEKFTALVEEAYQKVITGGE